MGDWRTRVGTKGARVVRCSEHKPPVWLCRSLSRYVRARGNTGHCHRFPAESTRVRSRLARGGTTGPKWTVDQHLLLWDRLSAGGVRQCGVGVSDTHGWRWDDPATAAYTENYNPYVTWVWLRSTSREGLVSALRRCRAYFGNPFVFHGTMDFRVDSSGAMGQLIVVRKDSVSIRLAITGATGLDLWMVQGLITPGPDVQYLRRERLA